MHEYITARELLELCGVRAPTLSYWMKHGIGPKAYRAHGILLFRRDEAIQWATTYRKRITVRHARAIKKLQEQMSD